MFVRTDISVLLGRYWVNISDTFLAGEFHQWKEGELTAIVHKPGSLSLIRLNSVTHSLT